MTIYAILGCRVSKAHNFDHDKCFATLGVGFIPSGASDQAKGVCTFSRECFVPDMVIVSTCRCLVLKSPSLYTFDDSSLRDS